MDRIDKDYTLLTIVILLAIIYFNWQNYFEYILLGLIVFAIAISASFLFGLKENKNDTVGIMVSFVLAINIVMFFLLLLSKYFNLTL